MNINRNIFMRFVSQIRENTRVCVSIGQYIRVYIYFIILKYKLFSLLYH